jgi:sugar lactone lactonase YvrE
MRKLFIIIGIVLLVFALSLAIFLRLRYGGGEAYPDISTEPILGSNALEAYFVSVEPVGNVAATRDTSYATRVFMTIHPESRPAENKVLEITGGVGVPFPNAEAQETLYETVLGLYVDHQNRLWTIDHGNHGLGDPKLLAFDLETKEIVHEFHFDSDIAERGSFLNDLTVTPDGKYVLIADVSFFAKKPSLVVYDIANQRARSLLDGHPAVSSQGYVPVTPAKRMRFLGGLIDLMPGIDGLDVDWDGEYVYWAAMSHESLYRLPVRVATDFELSDEKVEKQIELVAPKPLSDGIRVDTAGNVLITDIEHQGVYIVSPKGEGRTLIKDERIRWADGLSFGADGYWYLADSDIPNQMLQSKAHMAEHSPYYVFRFRY